MDMVLVSAELAPSRSFNLGLGPNGDHTVLAEGCDGWTEGYSKGTCTWHAGRGDTGFGRDAGGSSSYAFWQLGQTDFGLVYTTGVMTEVFYSHLSSLVHDQISSFISCLIQRIGTTTRYFVLPLQTIENNIHPTSQNRKDSPMSMLESRQLTLPHFAS